MKPTVFFLCLLACSGILLGDSLDPQSAPRKPPLLEEIVRMTRAGSSDVEVLAYAKAHRLELPPEVSDQDLRWLRESGVSELVVRYMSAIDVRASDEATQENAASGSYERPAPSHETYSSPENTDDSYGNSYPESYADNYYDTYPGYPYGYDYGYSPYPYFGYDYYPYPFFFIIDRDGFVHRFRGHGRRFGGRRGFDGRRGFGGRPGMVAGRGDAWRERGFSGRRGNTIVVGPRGGGRTTFARRAPSFPPNGHGSRVVGSRGVGPRASAPAFRGSRGGMSGPTGFGHRGFSSGSRSGSGAFSRSPRAAVGLPGGRGRR